MAHQVTWRDYLRLIRFEKPIGTLLLLWPTLEALFIASHGRPPIYTIIVFSVGTLLMRSFGCITNDMFDSKYDKHVLRTQDRVLASGIMTNTQAFMFAIVLGICAFVMALLFLHKNTLFLTIPAVIICIAYPLMKRFFYLPQLYLGVAFSFGILMGGIEILNHIPIVLWGLFLANFCWVFAYDTIYALCDKADDIKLNLKTSAITLGQYTVSAIAACFAIYVLIFIGIGYYLHLNILYYLGMLYVIWIIIYQVRTLKLMQEEEYFKLFLLNNRIGVCTFISLMLGFL